MEAYCCSEFKFINQGVIEIFKRESQKAAERLLKTSPINLFHINYTNPDHFAQILTFVMFKELPKAYEALILFIFNWSHFSHYLSFYNKVKKIKNCSGDVKKFKITVTSVLEAAAKPVKQIILGSISLKLFRQITTSKFYKEMLEYLYLAGELQNCNEPLKVQQVIKITDLRKEEMIVYSNHLRSFHKFDKMLIISNICK